MNMTSVLVIGLDGATWRLLSWLIDRECMPFLKRFLKECSYGILKSVIPPYSAPAWASMYTGVNPGKHAVFDFLDRRGRVVTSRNLRSEPIWNILSRYKVHHCIVNALLTYPPPKVHGVIVCAWDSPPGKLHTYPPDIAHELENLGYRVDLEYQGNHIAALLGDKYVATEILNKHALDLVHEAIEISRRHAEAAIKLASRYSWQFFMVIFTLTDVIQHLFWHMKPVLKLFYSALDKILAELISYMKSLARSEPLYIFIVSDHGFGSSPKVGINMIKVVNAMFPEFRKGSIRDRTILGLASLIPTSMRRVLMRVLRRFHIKEKAESLERERRIIDVRGICIYINREVLDIKQYTRLRVELRELLSNLRGPDGSKLFRQVLYSDDLYWGPYVSEGPDLVCIPNEEYVPYIDPLCKGYVIVDPYGVSGSHHVHTDGIYIIYGPHIRRGYLSQLLIYDILPTVLWLLDIPIPNNLDGKPALELFRKEFVKRNPPRYTQRPSAELINRLAKMRERLKRGIL